MLLVTFVVGESRADRVIVLGETREDGTIGPVRVDAHLESWGVREKPKGHPRNLWRAHPLPVTIEN